ncbi:hypothetical protein [Oceanispirochaeta sp.]|jgi:hypothetical protein|uniref:hypothetical protein n=1 Tax=Oceanispirochaeta sp. TaxID=2035350 RepID=UPI00261DF202|nr:hypothetical protein [Oceanispirochaeta sp.]MDA3955890.1 hypothetical protein [Oceanispirochaeta sp.]
MNKGLKINDELKRIVDSLGDVYLNMAENYPKLMRKLEGKIEALGSNQGNDRSSMINMDHLVQEIEQTVSNEGAVLNDISNRDSRFLDRISEELNTIKDLDNNIDQIEDDSAELELISLNAMVTALKAGKNGGAFPYITEELQKVSKSSAKLSNGLKTKGKDLSNYFAMFLGNINMEKDTLASLVSSIGKDFSNLTERTATYQKRSFDLIDTVKKQVKEYKKPLYEILAEVQKHDIVRQSIDHVILAIEHIRPAPDSNVEEQLESLTYGSRVYGFCNDILNEIHTELNKTYLTFKEKSEDLNSLIGYLQNSGKKMREYDNAMTSRDEIVSIQRNIENQLEKLKKDSVQIHIQKTLEGIYKEIANLEDAYKGFSKIISWVKTINISSRVEAAKLPHLENMGYIIENISNRANSIEKSVDTIIHSISDFKKHSDTLFHDYFSVSSKDNDHIEFIASELKSNLTLVNDYSSNLDFRMSELLSTVDDFLQLYRITNQDLKRMEILVKEILGIIKEVQGEKTLVDQDMNRLLTQEGLNSWELKGNEIKQLIDKFTIYIHKKKVESGDSLEIDKEGAISGEVTLF